MNGKQAFDILRWTRMRTERILKPLPNKFFDFCPENLCKTSFGKPYGIMEHIVNAEIVYVQDYIIGKGKAEFPKYCFEKAKKSEIVNALNETRKITNGWLESRYDDDFDKLMFNKRFHMSWIFFHLAEHEAHHMGQIALLMQMAGYEAPNV